FGSRAPRSAAILPKAGSIEAIDMAIREKVSATSAMNSALERWGPVVGMMELSRMPDNSGAGWPCHPRQVCVRSWLRNEIQHAQYVEIGGGLVADGTVTDMAGAR